MNEALDLNGLKVVGLNLTICFSVVRFEKQAKRNQ